MHSAHKLTEDVQKLLADHILPDPYWRNALNKLYQRRLLEHLMRAISTDGCAMNDNLCQLFIEAELVSASSSPLCHVVPNPESMTWTSSMCCYLLMMPVN